MTSMKVMCDFNIFSNGHNMNIDYKDLSKIKDINN